MNACNGLFYYPTRVAYSRPEEQPTRCEQVAFASGDGTRLHGWLLHPAGGAAAEGTVLFFHGNAQNLSSHVNFVNWMPIEGFRVFIFDYRGYGRSEGKPAREGIHQDCLAAIAYLRGRSDIDATRLLVFGQSLGGACGLAALGEGIAEQGEEFRRGIRGIAVESSFHSYRGIANTVLGGTFLTWPLVWCLIGNGHSPADSIERLASIPLLVIHGDADPVVPFSQGERLFRAAPEPKEFWRVPGGGHTAALCELGPVYRPRLLAFFRECLRSGE
ncbi:MAG: alpha/beta hydrolase [Planctomycetes bacterium]|nr:alpha/beta hydrolase [Planctomycetota bacterium]